MPSFGPRSSSEEPASLESDVAPQHASVSSSQIQSDPAKSDSEAFGIPLEPASAAQDAIGASGEKDGSDTPAEHLTLPPVLQQQQQQQQQWQQQQQQSPGAKLDPILSSQSQQEKHSKRKEREQRNIPSLHLRS
ncbi:unnamed protein product [Closterium sp. Naga37s-1]|nr:unnamed protein product [Closterium sp. Naga37s-1]